jgi:hypothetical protein
MRPVPPATAGDRQHAAQEQAVRNHELVSERFYWQLSSSQSSLLASAVDLKFL